MEERISGFQNSGASRNGGSRRLAVMGGNECGCHDSCPCPGAVHINIDAL